MNTQKFIFNLLIFLSLVASASTYTITISNEEAQIIGEKIWKNECGGSFEGLTHWNKGESFPSLGIGHFIWYPKDKKERFQETFPDLLIFLQESGVTLPSWLSTNKECPWNSQEEFYHDIQSPEMKALRQFLFDTRHLQAIFIVNRLNKAFSKILSHCSETEQKQITAIYQCLSEDTKGLYAIIDYLNFKGDGTSLNETYKGQGWGLLQVLRGMPPSSNEPLVDFVQSAKIVLEERVQNSPPERNEKRWLKGWHNRIDTYLAQD
ncbi:MAG: hypothetical protein KDK96_06765 [Chlamydiia bacterium]|nr:hypothetical protein [Chlamydiia bacterium]